MGDEMKASRKQACEILEAASKAACDGPSPSSTPSVYLAASARRAVEEWAYHAPMAAARTIWTVGHSNHELDAFLRVVEPERLTHILDVRSYPYSRHASHFNREGLQASVEACGLTYVFLGLALGGRPQREDQYDDDGHALYGSMAQEPRFQAAVRRLVEGAAEHRLCLLCSCGRPDDCHRRLLVGKVLCEHGVELRHILTDGSIRAECQVALPPGTGQNTLFGHDSPVWRSTQSVSRKRRLSASSDA